MTKEKAICEFRELWENHSPITERIFEAARAIERDGEITKEHLTEIETVSLECLEISKKLGELLQGVRHG